MFKVFSFLENNDYTINYDKDEKKIIPNLFIGLLPEKIKSFHFKIPEIIKPSPLNFLYKDISQKKLKLSHENCYFTYLDFDAY